MTSAERLSHDLMALRVAQELRPGTVVNLGVGLPTLVANYVPVAGSILLHSENGLAGYGPSPQRGQENPNLVNAGGQMVTLLPGASFMNHSESFSVIRGGHIDLAVLGGLQVSEQGDLASWLMPGRTLGGPGGAVDLASGASRVIAMMRHTTRDGKPKLVRKCTSPLTGTRCVDIVISDIAVIHVTNDGLILREVAPGWSVDEVLALTDAPLHVADDLREMSFAQEAPAPVSKLTSSAREAVADIFDGAVIMIDGFGGPGGMPQELILALRDHGAQDLTIISNTGGLEVFGTTSELLPVNHSVLFENGQVRKLVATFPATPSPARPNAFELLYKEGKVELEIMPQGTLVERINAGGAGVAAFYTPTGVGTVVSHGKERRVINGREYLLEYALRADFALIRAYKADTMGNLLYRGTSRNFNAPMATAGNVTIAEVDEVVLPGEIDPEAVVTPGLYVNRVVERREKGIISRE